MIVAERPLIVGCHIMENAGRQLVAIARFSRSKTISLTSATAKSVKINFYLDNGRHLYFTYHNRIRDRQEIFDSFRKSEPRSIGTC